MQIAKSYTKSFQITQTATDVVVVVVAILFMYIMHDTNTNLVFERHQKPNDMPELSHIEKFAEPRTHELLYSLTHCYSKQD